MVNTPSHKCPVRSMPKTAQEKYDQDIPNMSKETIMATSQGNIYIIYEPSIQRDMPTSPKFGYI